MKERSRSRTRSYYNALGRGIAGSGRLHSRSSSPRPVQLSVAGHNDQHFSPATIPAKSAYPSDHGILVSNENDVPTHELDRRVSVGYRRAIYNENPSRVDSERNYDFIYKTDADSPYPRATAPVNSNKTTLAIPIEEYDSFQDQKDFLQKIISDQRKLLRQVNHLLVSGHHVLESEGQLAMDLSQKMQRGETIEPDKVTEAWLSANHLLEEAAAFRAMFHDWSDEFATHQQQRRPV